MHERFLVVQRKRTFRGPAIQSIPVDTCVVDGKIRPRPAPVWSPVEGDDGSVRMTHESLADVVHTVIWDAVSSCSTRYPSSDASNGWLGQLTNVVDISIGNIDIGIVVGMENLSQKLLMLDER